MANMNVANTILSQLGGQRFIAMTGAKNFVSDGNTLRMTLPRNKSKANRLFVTLDGDDTYTMWFFKFTMGKINIRTGKITEDKIVDVRRLSGVYCDQLQEIFTATTGMYTRF